MLQSFKKNEQQLLQCSYVLAVSEAGGMHKQSMLYCLLIHNKITWNITSGAFVVLCVVVSEDSPLIHTLNMKCYVATQELQDMISQQSTKQAQKVQSYKIKSFIQIRSKSTRLLSLPSAYLGKKKWRNKHLISKAACSCYFANTLSLKFFE